MFKRLGETARLIQQHEWLLFPTAVLLIVVATCVCIAHVMTIIKVLADISCREGSPSTLENWFEGILVVYLAVAGIVFVSACGIFTGCIFERIVTSVRSYCCELCAVWKSTEHRKAE